MNYGLVVALFDIGGPEMMLILVVVLMLFGAKKLPEMMRNLGRSVEEFKRAANNVRNEVMTADLLEENKPTHTPATLPETTTPASEYSEYHPEATSPVSESGEPVAGDVAAAAPVAVEASKAEFTLQVASQPPAGTVSHNESHEEKPAQPA